MLCCIVPSYRRDDKLRCGLMLLVEIVKNNFKTPTTAKG
jgi:hypothetical protein